jgi:hypothetical protein
MLCLLLYHQEQDSQMAQGNPLEQTTLGRPIWMVGILLQENPDGFCFATTLTLIADNLKF